ncbi:MAG: DUF1554 domain-containing protein [Spirochaetota bacterium]
MVKGQYVLCLALGVVTGCMNTDAGRENVQEYLDGFRPTLLEYASDTFVFPEGAVITPQIPRVLARLAISRCTVVPALPAGLALENTTCAFSGTPVLAQAAAGYTITASNDAGSISALISIRISTPPPSSLTYTGSPYAFVKTAPITTITPTVTGIVTSCTASPPLPGLTLNNATCEISGSATSSQLQTTHTITASNTEGSTSTTIDLTIFRVLFIASGTSGSNMANSGVADNYCNTAGNKPAGTGNYKAMMSGWGTRRACSSNNCTTSGAAENLDWALAPNTQYRRNDLSTIIMTTNSAGIFVFGTLQATIVATPLPGGSPITLWTGLSAGWLSQSSSGTCGGNWSTPGGTGVYGLINRTNSTLLHYSTATPCSSNSGQLACAQQ